jgi:DNA helicase II / ATP-dependent DNA helicase PcrA
MRFMRRLYLTRAVAQNWWGRPSFHRQSRFLGEVPAHLIEWRRDEGLATAPAMERAAAQPGGGFTGQPPGARALAGGQGDVVKTNTRMRHPLRGMSQYPSAQW